MKVFLSWSGEMSHQVAIALHNWLPYVIQSLKPFVSSGDINKGARWSDVLAQELNDTEYGVVCVTPYNIDAPWLNFEAGALSKAIDRSYVSPLLFRVDRTAIRGPLSQFQSTVYEKEDIYNLLTSINNRFKPEEQLDNELLKGEFEVWWKNLEEALDAIPDSQRDETQCGYDWLYTLEDLIKVEIKDSINSVWVITPDIYEHVLNPKVREAMQTNIERGIKYKFIIPNSCMTDAVEGELRDNSLDQNKLAIKDIPDEEFHSQAVTNYIILNPDHDESCHLQVFLELPISSRGMWTLVDDEAALGFTARFRKMWDAQYGFQESGAEAGLKGL